MVSGSLPKLGAIPVGIRIVTAPALLGICRETKGREKEPHATKRAAE
jgi:hypothetical protein